MIFNIAAVPQRLSWMFLAMLSSGLLLILTHNTRQGEWCLASAMTLATFYKEKTNNV